MPEVLSRVRRVFSLPVALGFGLRVPEQLDALPKDIRPDAAVFGSSLLRHIAAGKAPADFIKTWEVRPVGLSCVQECARLRRKGRTV